MNIFFLNLSPSRNARLYFNRHCIKIILEIAQMLYTAHWCSPNTATIETVSIILADGTKAKPYRKTHYNHPTAKWVRQCSANYKYTCEIGIALCREYTRRYKKTHKTQAHLEWLSNNIPEFMPFQPIQAFLATQNIPIGCTPIPLAMPAEFHSPDALYSYRLYYVVAKAHLKDKDIDICKYIDDWGLRPTIHMAKRASRVSSRIRGINYL